jgi:hypothetical protein
VKTGNSGYCEETRMISGLNRVNYGWAGEGVMVYFNMGIFLFVYTRFEDWVGVMGKIRIVRRSSCMSQLCGFVSVVGDLWMSDTCA